MAVDVWRFERHVALLDRPRIVVTPMDRLCSEDQVGERQVVEAPDLFVRPVVAFDFASGSCALPRGGIFIGGYLFGCC